RSPSCSAEAAHSPSAAKTNTSDHVKPKPTRHLPVGGRSMTISSCRPAPPLVIRYPTTKAGDGGVVARRRRYYKIEGQLSLEDLWKEGAGEDEPLRGDGPASLGTVATGAVRDDPGSGQLLLDTGGGSSQADRGPDPGSGGRRSARGGLPGEGGPAEHGPPPGGGDRPARAGSAHAGTGRRPGHRRRGRSWSSEPLWSADDRGPQPSAVGAGERRAGGTGPGQLAGERFRPHSQDDLAPSGAVARIRANLAALSALRGIQ